MVSPVVKTKNFQSLSYTRRQKSVNKTTVFLPFIILSSLVAYFPPVHVFSMGNLHNKYTQNIILDGADNSVITDTIFPKLAQLRASEGFANTAWVVQFGYTLTQKIRNAFRNLLVQL